MSLTIFYVQDVALSVRYYQAVLGDVAIEHSPSFAMFRLNNGAMLGLWKRSAVQPAPPHTGGGGELVITVPDVDAAHIIWAERGATIIQPPMDMEFGRNFLALDPDQHRLRVLKPA